MNPTIAVKAYAKINLNLDITGRRADGYHLLRTVMQTVSLYDELRVTLNPQGTIRVFCTEPGVPSDRTNSVFRAASAFLTAAGFHEGAEIRLCKNIPIQAGLGGGSADAAAVLRALNALYGAPLPLENLMEIGAKIGADVPFCLCGGTALCKGIGEIITPLRALPECRIVLCKPPVGVNTAQAFAAIDREAFCSAASADAMIQAVSQGNLRSIGSLLSNDFLRAPVPEESLEALKKMREFSPLGAGLSGSGPTVFALFDEVLAAQECACALRPYYGQVFVTEPVSSAQVFSSDRRL